jgi:hypothetical protein
MYNKHTTALYAAVIASVLVASVFAISYVQMALAQQDKSTLIIFLLVFRVKIPQLTDYLVNIGSYGMVRIVVGWLLLLKSKSQYIDFQKLPF